MHSGSKTVSVSPFALVFSKGGLASAGHVVNAIILITVSNQQLLLFPICSSKIFNLRSYHAPIAVSMSQVVCSLPFHKKVWHGKGYVSTRFRVYSKISIA